MSKGIIVVDIPENCGLCSFCEKNKKWCTTKDVFIAYYYYRVSKPEWCPIKPVPEKKEITGTITSKYDGRVYAYDPYASGYNACIDEILGGAE